MTVDTELDESVETETSHGINRRTLVKGGLIAGGALWATPVVQILGTRIAAAASVAGGTAVSYVTLVLQKNGTTSCFLMLADQSGHIACGGDSSSDGVRPASTYKVPDALQDYLYDNRFAFGQATTCDPNGATAKVNGGLEVTITTGYTLVGYMIHDGSLKNYTTPTGQGTWNVRFMAGTIPPAQGDNHNSDKVAAPAPGGSTVLPGTFNVTQGTDSTGQLTYTFSK